MQIYKYAVNTIRAELSPYTVACCLYLYYLPLPKMTDL